MLRTAWSVIGATVCAMPMRCSKHRRHLGQALPGSQRFGAQHVRGQIAVAELEPVRRAEPAQRIHEIPGFAGEAPASLRIVQVGDGVENGIDVGRDMQAEMHEIVGRVDDDGQFDRAAARR